MISLVGDHRHCLAIESNEYSVDRTSVSRLENDALANPKLHHVLVRLGLSDCLDASSDPAIEPNEVMLAEMIDIDVRN